MHCTDPMTVIDIPTLLNETGDRLALSERRADAIVFVIEKIAASDAG